MTLRWNGADQNDSSCKSLNEEREMKRRRLFGALLESHYISMIVLVQYLENVNRTFFYRHGRRVQGRGNLIIKLEFLSKKRTTRVSELMGWIKGCFDWLIDPVESFPCIDDIFRALNRLGSVEERIHRQETLI